MLCSILSLSSCWPGFILFNLKGEVKKKYTIQYDCNYKVDTNELAINGYYMLVDSNKYYRFPTFVLMPDGVFASFDLKDSVGIHDVHLKDNMYHWNNDKQCPNYTAGLYKIDNDTLIVETYRIEYYYWRLFHVYYLIVNKNILSYKKVEWYDFGKHTKEYEGITYQFIPAKNLPCSDETYFKKEKWLWKDKKAYKRWKEEYKKARKKNKK